MTAGVTAFTRTFCWATSLANAFVNPSTAAFEEEYADMFGLPSLPEIDDTFTIRPYPRSIIPGTTCLQSRNTASTLIAMVRRHSLSSYSHTGFAGPAMPALL